MGILYSKGVRYSGSGKIDATLSTSSANAIANSAVATAINQINSDLTELKNPTPDITYTATATMTGAQILAWLRANVDFSKLNIRSKISVGGAIFNIWVNDGIQLSAYGVATNPTSGTVSIAFLTAYSGSAYDRWFNGSTNVLTSSNLYTGGKLEIYY